MDMKSMAKLIRHQLRLWSATTSRNGNDREDMEHWKRASHSNHFRSLSFFPGGETEQSKEYIGLFLRLNDSDSTKFQAKVVLGIVGKDNKTHEYGGSGDGFKYGYYDWNYREFMKREELCDPSKEFLTAGKLLMIFCEVI